MPPKPTKQDTASGLFEIRNYFILGNWRAAINVGNSLSGLKDQDKHERDVYIYRSYIAQGNYRIVLDEIKESHAPSLQALKLLASFYLSPDNRESIVTKLKEWLQQGISQGDDVLQITAATIYTELGNYEDALRCIYTSTTLESLSFVVQLYLRINRLDLAEKELEKLQKLDEDATITLLSTAWVHLHAGGDRSKEALGIFQDLVEKYGSTVTLLNGIGVSHLAAKRYNDAEKVFLQALEKKASDSDTIINLIATYQHQQKPQDIITRYLSQLKTSAPTHPWLLDYQKMETNFDQFAAQLTV